MENKIENYIGKDVFMLNRFFEIIKIRITKHSAKTLTYNVIGHNIETRKQYDLYDNFIRTSWDDYICETRDSAYQVGLKLFQERIENAQKALDDFVAKNKEDNE